MAKYFYFILISLGVFSHSFSQEIEISTEFSIDGILYKSIDNLSHHYTRKITEFKNEEACIVLDYLGKDVFKIKYKSWVGYVDSEYLVFNDEMSDLFYDFQEKERIKAIEQKEARQKIIQEIVKSSNAESNENKQEDSLVKVQAEERQKATEQATIARKLESERVEQTKQDSIVNIQEEKIKTNIEDESAEKEKLERINYRNTCHYAMNEYDAIDRIRIVRTDPYQINDNLTIELFKRGSSTNVFFNLKRDLGCASYLPSNRSNVKVRLENNQTIIFYHSWDMDCGDFSFKGTISRSQMELLKKSPIKSIMLRGTKYSHDVVNVEYKEFFIDKLKCIE